MEITYKGITINTKKYNGELEPDKIKYIRDNYFNTVSHEEALNQLEKVLLKNKLMINKIYAYYFEKVAAKCKLNSSKWSIYDMLQCDELVQANINSTYKNKKVFPEKNGLLKNFKTAIRIGGCGTGKLSNFPFKECKRLLSNHLSENTLGLTKTYLDPCCGWGVRMLASAALDINYIGFDVNPELIVQLNKLGKDIQRFKPNWEFKVYECGSETKVDELDKRADIIMTSPPYFNLEEYNSDDKHSNQYESYEHWLDVFVNPMINNCYDYAKDNAHVMFNVKHFKKWDLVEDFKRIGESVGFKFLGYDSLKNIKRQYYTKDSKDLKKANTDEKVIVFEK